MLPGFDLHWTALLPQKSGVRGDLLERRIDAAVFAARD